MSNKPSTKTLLPIKIQFDPMKPSLAKGQPQISSSEKILGFLIEKYIPMALKKFIGHYWRIFFRRIF
jgi:hypothetical protein